MSAGTSPAAQSSKKAQQSARLRPARFEDYQQIAELESRHGLGELADKSYESWAHLWRGNPAYREVQSDWPIGWVLEAENGRLTGSMGNIPLEYEIHGKRILASSGRAWVAEPAYRGVSLLLLEHLVNQPGVDVNVNNTVSDAALAGVEFFGCQRVPAGRWDEWAGWITNYPSFFERALAMKNYPLAGPLSYPLSAAFFVKDRLKRIPVRESDVQVVPCAWFDDRFDDFWMELRARMPEVLLAVRTREALEWHFKYAFLKNRLWIATITDGSRLSAYAIFDRRDKLSLGFKRMRLVDFQSLNGGTELLFPILAWALEKCRAEGIHVLANIGRYLDESGFVETASFRQKLPAWAFFYRTTDPLLAETLQRPSAWAPSLYDGDASL